MKYMLILFVILMSGSALANRTEKLRKNIQKREIAQEKRQKKIEALKSDRENWPPSNERQR